eukprot:m.177928 g.177928  ORF g.177928 m.177928 type:complete len:625 (+) comp16827_c0_seq4:1307-3181(+)
MLAHNSIRCIVIVLLFQVWMTCSHPQCNDFRAPFASQGLFCSAVEIGNLTCCAPALQQQLEQHLSNFFLTPSCLAIVEELICVQCHPYAEHVFTTPNDGLYPGLCPSQCQKLQLACMNETVPVGLDLVVSVSASPSFCQPFMAEDAGYCYPDTPAINQSTVDITSNDHLCLQPVSSAWQNAISLVQPDDGMNRLAVIEQRGVVWMVDEQDMERRYAFLDLRSRTTALSKGDERGLHSIAFHPEFRTNGRFYVIYYRTLLNREELATFTSTSDLMYGVRSSGSVILTVDQPYKNHNGGTLLFDSTGMLLVTFGDGGGAGDPVQSGQDKNSHLGSILRLNVTATLSYTIPTDNPFLNTDAARSEIYAWGLRNPWRCSIDRVTDRLICGDVGQNKYEEVIVVNSGDNHGWRAWEGSSCYDNALCNTVPNIAPVYEYAHTTGHRSITGGHVYRGCEYPLLQGSYVFGDFVSGTLFVLDSESNATHWQGKPVNTGDSDVCVGDLSGIQGHSILSLGEDLQGNLYVLATTSPSLKAHPQQPNTGIYKLVDPRLRNPSCNISTAITSGRQFPDVGQLPTQPPSDGSQVPTRRGLDRNDVWALVGSVVAVVGLVAGVIFVTARARLRWGCYS